MGILITQSQLDLARASGACANGLGQIRVGERIDELPCLALAFAEGIMPQSEQLHVIADLLEESRVPILGTPSLAVLGGSGYGYGYGSGDGYGDGDG